MVMERATRAPYRLRMVARMAARVRGAENLYYEPSGAYTGEVSADMLKTRAPYRLRMVARMAVQTSAACSAVAVLS